MSLLKIIVLKYSNIILFSFYINVYGKLIGKTFLRTLSSTKTCLVATLLFYAWTTMFANYVKQIRMSYLLNISN